MKKLLVLLLCGSFLQASEFSKAAGLMKAKSWRPVSALGLTGDMVKTGPVMDVIYAFSNDAIWDPMSEQLLYIGGPHLTTMRFNTYTASTNMWRGDSFPEGETCLSHSYDNLTIDTSGHMYWFHNGKIYVRNIAENVWAPSLPGPGTGSRYGSLEYFPEKNALVYVLGGSVYKMPFATKVWSTVRSGLSMGGIHNLAQYNPVYHRIYFGGGDSKAQWSLDTNWQCTALPDAPINYGVAVAHQTVDPVSGQVLFINGDSVYYYDPGTGENGCSGPSFVTSPNQSAVAPVAMHGFIAFLTTTQYPLLLYRHSLPTALEKCNSATLSTTLCSSPNPFNPETRIRLPDNNTQVDILDISGHFVTRLTGKGEVVWYARHMPAGIYIATMTGQTQTRSIRLFLIK